MTALQIKDKAYDVDLFRGKVLSWYDKHARILPWRALPKTHVIPYHVWLSEIMLQQTTVPTVKSYFEKFLKLWPTIEDLAAAKQEDILKEWAGLGYYARARNLHRCAQIVVHDYEGMFPDEELELLKLPGIGPYTAAAITSIAFDKPAAVMDGNIERIMARIFAVPEPLPDSKPILKSYVESVSLNRTDRPGDFAQALMDIGASICTPNKPKCSLCPIETECLAKRQGIQTELPRKKKKEEKPQRFGHVYWIENDQEQVFVIRRPQKGLLAGMLAFPSTEWKESGVVPMMEAKPTGQFVTHVFTHFKLKLEIYTASSISSLEGEWIAKKDIEGLPTVFQKVLNLMRQAS